MGIFRFFFSCITQAIKIAIGVAITIALFFALGYLIDVFAAKKTAPPSDPRLRPYADRGMPLSGSAQRDTDKTDSLYLSFFETLLNKKPELMPEPPRTEHKAGHAGKKISRPVGRKPLQPSRYRAAAEAENYQTAAAPAQPQPAAAGAEITYTLQLGSFQSNEVAASFSSSLKAKGYGVRVVQFSVPDKGTVYRVRLGRYKKLEDAQKAAAELEKKEGISAFITSK